MTFVEDPLDLRADNLTIPQNFYDACTKQQLPYVGNAGGNTKNWLNLAHAPTHPPQNPWG